MQLIKWLAIRAALYTPAWVFAHAIMLLWKFKDETYLEKMTWINKHILEWLHPAVVLVVNREAPAFKTFAHNHAPTHEDAAKFIYPFLFGIIVVLALGFMTATRVVVQKIRTLFAKWRESNEEKNKIVLDIRLPPVATGHASARNRENNEYLKPPPLPPHASRRR